MKKYKDTNYLISDKGEVFSIRGNRYLTPNKTKLGYARIHLGRTLYIFVHRLVAECYIPNPNNYPYVNHIDGNGLNNNVSNLEWCTQRQNVKHAYDIGLNVSVKGENKYNASLKDSDIPVIRNLYTEQGYNYAEIARMYEVRNSVIWQIIKRTTWKHVN